MGWTVLTSLRFRSVVALLGVLTPGRLTSLVSVSVPRIVIIDGRRIVARIGIVIKLSGP